MTRQVDCVLRLQHRRHAVQPVDEPVVKIGVYRAANCSAASFVGVADSGENRFPVRQGMPRQGFVAVGVDRYGRARYMTSDPQSPL
jgi:hypothetical protein